MPSEKKRGRSGDRAPEDPLLIVLFEGTPLAPVPIPLADRRPFDVADPPTDAVMGQSAWLRENVGNPNRKGLVFGVTFVFPDERDVGGVYDRNFTCRTLYSLLNYIMYQYAWPQSVKDRFPGGRVCFHELIVLDHNNVRVTPTYYDAILLNSTRLDLFPKARIPINFTVLCFKHGPRVSSVALTHRRLEGGVEQEASCSVVVIHHQTFRQLLYSIHKQVNRVAAFHSNTDSVVIFEDLLDETAHLVTQETYGTRIFDPDARLSVEFIQRSP